MTSPIQSWLERVRTELEKAKEAEPLEIDFTDQTIAVGTLIATAVNSMPAVLRLVEAASRLEPSRFVADNAEDRANALIELSEALAALVGGEET